MNFEQLSQGIWVAVDDADNVLGYTYSTTEPWAWGEHNWWNTPEIAALHKPEE